MSVHPIPTVLIPADTYDLIDIDIAKDELKIDPTDTTNDAWLARAITQVSVLVQNYVKRPLAVETISELIDLQQDPYPFQLPGGVMALQLSRWPVGFVESADQMITLDSTQSLQADKDYRVDGPNGQLVRISPFTGVAQSWESMPVTIVYEAGYDEIPADVVDATLRLVVNRWHSRGRDPLLLETVQPGVGTQRWWVGGPKGGGTLPSEVQGMLDLYRSPTVA